jgi:ATP-binding cassette subfamily B protein
LKFPFYKQPDQMDCGPTCLRMIAKHHGRSYSLQKLRDLTYADREGVSLLGISYAAEQIGFHTLSAKVSLENIINDLPLPFIAHWRQNHFLIVYKATKKHIHVADPAFGTAKLTHEEFMTGWLSDVSAGEKKGIVLLFETTPEFFETENEKVDKTGFGFLFSYIFKYKKLITQLVLGLVVASLLQLIFPFLTQSIVDFGINNEDIDFIYLILLAQLTLFISQTSVGFIRSWILLHIGARVNISLISDFLLKLMRLPVRFFDTKMIGDLLQRINDHYRIETFLTSTTLNTAFSIFSFVVFGAVLLFYNTAIFGIFILGSFLYIGWILLFLKRRKVLDYKSFEQRAKNQNKLIQLIYGMQEIKLHNAEKLKRWEWEHIQANLYKVNMKVLALTQYQQAGSSFINELKNIIISFLAAKAVIEGNMTLGSMLAIQYIIGQLNAPLVEMINFITSSQDAKISLERLGEIHEQDNEEDIEDSKIDILPEEKSLKLSNLSFRYGGPSSPWVLRNMDLVIPEGKVTAIVGASGSGKTTLLKLLLKFYPPSEGDIKLGDLDLENIRNYTWRERCGVVMQDGYIFSDTIAKNIALGEEKIDKTRLIQAVKAANIQEFVERLPLGYNTKIGDEGIGVSGGQKQRLMIARAVYKSPEYLLFDEATSSLDANNEKAIMEKLGKFFEGRTVVVVAHRLSTVKNADQIIVLDKGEIIERGNHETLAAKKGAYYKLVKNQLELGN